MSIQERRYIEEKIAKKRWGRLYPYRWSWRGGIEPEWFKYPPVGIYRKKKASRWRGCCSKCHKREKMWKRLEQRRRERRELRECLND